MKKITMAIALLSVGTYMSAQTNQIQSSGNVGIGTTTPTKELEVSGETKMDGDVEMTKDATVRENLKVDKNVYVVGTTNMTGDFTSNGTSFLNGVTYIPNLQNAPITQNSLQNGFVLVQGGNGKVFKTPISKFSEIIYSPFLNCLSDVNGNVTPQWQSSPGQIVMKCHGNLGVGTYNPTHKLHIDGNALITKNAFVEGYIKIGTSSLYLGTQNPVSGTSNDIWSDNGDLFIQSAPGAASYNTWINKLGGQVIIGNVTSPDPQYKVEIQGGVRACRFVAEATSWCDFVFEKDYDLMSIDELKIFLKRNKHLPNVPSEKEAVNSEIDLVEMDKILLQKVEELHLYVIQLNDENKKLKEEIELLKSEMKKNK